MLKISFTKQFLKDKQILTLVLVRTGTHSDLF